MRHFFILGLAILLSSCASTTTNYYTKTVDSWRGGNSNDLLKHWGRPDGWGTGQDGSRMYVYRTQNNRGSSVSSSPSFGVSAGSNGKPVLTTYPSTNRTWNRGAMSQTCTAVFEASKSGKITNTKIQGSGCFATEDFSNRMSNPLAKKQTGTS